MNICLFITMLIIVTILLEVGFLNCFVRARDNEATNIVVHGVEYVTVQFSTLYLYY